MDLCLFGKNNGVPVEEIAGAVGLTAGQVNRVFRDIDQKRKTTEYLHAGPELVGDVPEISRGGDWIHALSDPIPFSRRHSLVGHPVPPRASAPLTIGLPRRPQAARTRAGFPFRTRKTRPGPGALSTPGTAVPARPRVNPATAACRLATAGPCHPGTTTRPGMPISRVISKGSLAFAPPGHSPHL